MGKWTAPEVKKLREVYHDLDANGLREAFPRHEIASIYAKAAQCGIGPRRHRKILLICASHKPTIDIVQFGK